MKKLFILGTILVLLVVAVVPVMAKSPHGNGNGNGNGNGVKLTTPVPSLSSNTSDDMVTHPNNGRGHGKSNQGMGNSLSKNNGAQNQGRRSTPFYLQGTISAVDVTSDTITVTLTHGNAQVKQFIGTELFIKGEDAVVFEVTQGDDDEGEMIGQATSPTVSSIAGATNDEDNPAKMEIPFDLLAERIGKKVAIHGRVIDGEYIATMITVYVTEPVGESGGG